MGSFKLDKEDRATLSTYSILLASTLFVAIIIRPLLSWLGFTSTEPILQTVFYTLIVGLFSYILFFIIKRVVKEKSSNNLMPYTFIICISVSGLALGLAALLGFPLLQSIQSATEACVGVFLAISIWKAK